MNIQFDKTVFTFILFFWGMLIIITGWFTAPVFHALNGLGFLLIVLYLHLTLKNVVILYKIPEDK